MIVWFNGFLVLSKLTRTLLLSRFLSHFSLALYLLWAN
jgi:hypothetical protein